MVRTDFLDSRSLQRAKSVIDDYAATSGATRQWAPTDHREAHGSTQQAG